MAGVLEQTIRLREAVRALDKDLLAPGNDPAAQAQIAARAAEERRKRLRASTLLIGGQGDTSTPSLARRTLGV